MRALGQLLSIKKQSKKRIVFLDEKTLFFLFERVFLREYGIQGRNAIHLKKYKDSILYLSVDQSIWASEIWMRKKEIIEWVNKEIGSSELKDIRIQS